MKKITLYTSLFAAGILMFSACKKQADKTANYTLSDESTAYVRVVHAAPSFRQIFNAPDSFNVYVNDIKMNAPFLTYGAIFPSNASFGYVAVQPGLNQFRVNIHGFASASPDSTRLINFTKVFQAGQYYTLLMTDSITSGRDSSQMFLPDAYTKPLNGYYGLRFVHAVWNDTTGKTIDIYSARRNANIFTSVKPGEIKTFNSFASNTQLSDTLYVRRSGTQITLSQLNGVSFANQRSYTLVYRGDGNLATGTKARALATFLHN
ncbi:MAG: DUF4397 domain-containing protein [Chitinophagaceae bacterium]|nr:DUF4397 domain-containing protein [Chitinophagaceae bacterium]MCA6456831.1 DUF4397 domain-containing protein [Chitinophagaceae bacterium]MCA6463309.1 DUF4397 domain-containing protein [Chitinophagaceae bacterium]